MPIIQSLAGTLDFLQNVGGFGMVERFFRDLTDKRLRRGVFHDVEELVMAIVAWTRRARFKRWIAQPGLPLKKGRCGTMTHDYKRNGTATLFAALNTADGYIDHHNRAPKPPSV